MSEMGLKWGSQNDLAKVTRSEGLGFRVYTAPGGQTFSLSLPIVEKKLL